jgi:hypothetical protein
MTPVDPKTCEQLSAWMDGELPAEEARFLERRLEHDVELRATWERMQLASACMKGQALQPMRRGFSDDVLTALSAPGIVVAKRRPVRGWAIAASVAALAIMIGVQMRPETAPKPTDVIAHAAEVSAPPITASPASADLVASTPTMTTSAAGASDRIVKAAAVIRPTVVSKPASEVAALESPIPLDAQSPTDFPLAESSTAKSWPRSPLSSGSDPSMEAYLVRHNEMVSDGGLGGFVPYVDVVTRERDDSPAAGDAQAGEGDQK